MRQPQPRKVSAANKPFGRSSRSGRAERYPPPLGRAEQRSSVRIKTLALFERSEFASVPNAASSARNPKGTDVARLFFGYFLLAKQKKVTRPPGRDPACHRSEVTAANQTPQNPFFAYFLSAKPKESKSPAGARPGLPWPEFKASPYAHPPPTPAPIPAHPGARPGSGWRWKYPLPKQSCAVMRLG